MIAGIFAVIELILKLIGLWDQFLSYSDAKRAADAAAKQAALNKAVDASAGANSDDDIFKNQTDVVNNMPRP